MKKRWIYKEEPKGDTVSKLSKEINVNPYLAKILVQRGIKEFDQAKVFFRPDLNQLHDPFEMKDMAKAVNRLCEAVFEKEKILLYGDYDVDGTTAVSLMYLFLQSFTKNIDYYVPDRYTEGYGISEKGINWAKENGFQLIIALDCGIRAVERADHARKQGLDLIICDHHLPGEQLPNAYAILDPKQKDCHYPFEELSGCGVGFKLLEGFCQQNTIPKESLFNLLDLLAISIASDIVPIVGENRILAYYGLKKLNQSPSAGLNSLIAVSGKKGNLTVSDVVFKLGPRINAAGRLAHARESVELLIGENEEVSAHANTLDMRNGERKAFDQQITHQALEMIAEMPDQKSTVLFNEEWHKGVIGIVASRCIEHYYRPTIILTESNGKATGSARSVDGFDVHAALEECNEFLEQFGGHKYAAGLTMSLDNIVPFQKRFEEVVSNQILEDQLIPKVHIDIQIPLQHINFKMLNILQQMEPFGPQNLSPLFGTKNVKVKSDFQILKNEHIKGSLKDNSTDQWLEFIGFGLAKKVKDKSSKEFFSIAYHIEENNFMNQKSLVLNIKDIKFD